MICVIEEPYIATRWVRGTLTLLCDGVVICKIDILYLHVSSLISWLQLIRNSLQAETEIELERWQRANSEVKDPCFRIQDFAEVQVHDNINQFEHCRYNILMANSNYLWLETVVSTPLEPFATSMSRINYWFLFEALHSGSYREDVTKNKRILDKLAHSW